MKNSELKVGQLVEGFEITAIDPLPELNNVMFQLKSQKIGSLMVHLSNDDDNNCFSAGFKTIPYDSTGIAHILEHTALCGSKRFPVRDPFFSMIKKSMKTFMNAFTASDWTMYPFASQNEVDFFNLMDVYLDAVFFPLLSEIDFKQEGHRLEFSDHDDQNSPLTAQGVVYSEMRGAMSSQSAVMHHSTLKVLFPNIAYKYNSGGDPEEILSLTHEALIKFHKLHYHPSNALFYTYGNIPLVRNLKAINRVISKFEKADLDISIPDEQRYSSPQESIFRYQLDESDDDGQKAQVALSWLTCNIKDSLEVLSLQLINLILLGHSGSVLRKKLLESKLGKSLADTSGLEYEIRETYFSAGLQAVAPRDVDKVEKLILDALREITEQGIKPEQIESAVHQIELGTKEISGGHYPYSLNLLFRFFGPWLHGDDPLKNVNFNHTLEQLKAKIKKGPFLENQIKKYLIDNPHRVKVVLLPDSELEKERDLKLKKILAKTKSRLSEEDKNKIVEDAAKLKEHQDKKEDLSCLPTLKVSDIPPDVKYISPFQTGSGGLDVAFYECPTNGVLYVNWYFKMNNISAEDRKWLSLLGYLIGKTGAVGLSYEEMAERINLYTGGISASPIIESSFEDRFNCQEFFRLSSKALNRNMGKMFELVETIVNEWDFSDLDRIQVLIGQRSNNMTTSLINAGHGFAIGLAGRNLSPVSQVEETYGGVSQLRLMKKIVEADESETRKIVEKLNNILKCVFRKDNISVLVSGEKEIFQSVEPLIQNFVDKLKNRPDGFSRNSPISLVDFKAVCQNEIWLTTTPLSYVARSFKTAAFPHEDAPALLVLSVLLKSCFLHPEIREKGGAYGGMSSYNASEGIFTMVSYRDPQLAGTISVYDAAIPWLEKGSFSDREVEESIMQTCSALDTPKSPAERAASEHISRRRGITKELREQFRKGILKCRKEDLIRMTKKYLTASSAMAVITGEAAVQRDQDLIADKNFSSYNI